MKDYLRAGIVVSINDGNLPIAFRQEETKFLSFSCLPYGIGILKVTHRGDEPNRYEWIDTVDMPVKL